MSSTIIDPGVFDCSLSPEHEGQRCSSWKAQRTDIGQNSADVTTSSRNQARLIGRFRPLPCSYRMWTSIRSLHVIFHASFPFSLNPLVVASPGFNPCVRPIVRNRNIRSPSLHSLPRTNPIKITISVPLDIGSPYPCTSHRPRTILV